MSKGDGPGASSFESPRKVGWLYKQGGSGMTSHWRKRWFVADHHYLFYYKKPDDKSPVGILCLPEYDSCHKSEGKEWKKPNTFLLDKGKDPDSPDGPVKSYVLHSDTDEEMQEWIMALTEEMKPMLDGNKHEGLPNGKGQSTLDKKKKKTDATVDPKAFNELSVLASEGPKLTHLTASRPKVRNRRPPKRYAVFHEEDAKEDESPPPSPTPVHKPLPSSPSTSPSSQSKKGYRPSAPLIPNKPRPPTPVKAARSESTPVLDTAEPDTSPSEVKKRPLPPKKPQKEQPSPPTSSPQRKSSTTPEPPVKPRPIPPSKPSKTNIETTETAEPHNTTPVRKPRPPQPPKKPRSSTTTTPDETLSPVVEHPVPKPRPVPRKRTMITSEARPPPVVKEEEPKPVLEEEHLEEKQQDIAELKDAPQVVAEVTPDKLEVEAEELVSKMTDETPEIVQQIEESKQSEEAVLPSEESPSVEAASPVPEEATDDKIKIGEVKDTSEDAVEKDKVDDKENNKQDVVSEVGKEDKEQDKKSEAVQPSPHKEEVKEKGEDKNGDSTPDSEEDLYEDMAVGVLTPDDKQSDISKESTPAYEMVNFEPLSPSETRSPIVRHNYDMVPTESFASNTVDISVHQKETSSLVPQPVETSSKGEITSSYVMMDPASPIQLGEPPSPDEYIPMELGAGKTDSIDYDEPRDWGSSINESPRSTRLSDYDVPRPASDHLPEVQVNLEHRSPSLQSSSGSTGSKHGSPGLPRKGSKGQSDTPSHPTTLQVDRGEGVDGRRMSGESKTLSERDRSPSNPNKEIRRDSHGYTKVNKSDTERHTANSSFSSGTRTPPEIPPSLDHSLESSLDNVPGTLKQAREILRLAQVVKAEANEMKEEAQRELELARRERHDAELLKKNAAQILKMAKERLNDSKGR